jgi:hypothetical protein
MSWGKWIILSFVLFAAFIATLVTVCMRQDVNLVSKDYYQEELAYQDQITRLNNTNSLLEKPVIKKAGPALKVNFKEFNKIERGSLTLFKPSNPGMDRSFKLESTQEDHQSFPIRDLEAGMYRARLQWMMEGKEYFIETIINI